MSKTTESVSERLMEDIYDRKAFDYPALPWVNDPIFFELVLPSSKSIQGVVDLGCGPALLGRYVTRIRKIPYLGVDHSGRMLARAAKNLRSCENHHLIKADICSYNHPTLLRGFICVAKNVLHLVPNFAELVADVPRRYDGVNRLIIAETVSPDRECGRWIRSVFSLIPHRKINWFVVGDLELALKEIGCSILRNVSYEQLIDVGRWLDSFPMTGDEKETVLRRILSADSSIAENMRITELGDQILMRRLQNIIDVRLPC